MINTFPYFRWTNEYFFRRQLPVSWPPPLHSVPLLNSQFQPYEIFDLVFWKSIRQFTWSIEKYYHFCSSRLCVRATSRGKLPGLFHLFFEKVFVGSPEVLKSIYHICSSKLCVWDQLHPGTNILDLIKCASAKRSATVKQTGAGGWRVYDYKKKRLCIRAQRLVFSILENTRLKYLAFFVEHLVLCPHLSWP